MPVGDQLDLLIKTLIHLKAQGVDLGEHGNKLINASAEVKERHPKK